MPQTLADFDPQTFWGSGQAAQPARIPWLRSREEYSQEYERVQQPQLAFDALQNHVIAARQEETAREAEINRIVTQRQLDILRQGLSNDRRTPAQVREEINRTMPNRSWQNIAADIQRRFPNVDSDRLRPAYDDLTNQAQIQERLGEARTLHSRMPEGWAEYIGNRSVPFASVAEGLRASRDYEAAKRRIAAGNPQRDDYNTVAGHEQLQADNARRGETWGGYLGDVAATLPAMIGEGVVAGRALGGLGQAVPLIGRGAAAAGGRLGTIGSRAAMGAASLPGVPSMYIPQALQNAERYGGEWYEMRNLAPAVAIGAINMAILGQVSGGVGRSAGAALGERLAGGLGGRIAGAAGSRAGGYLSGIATGMAEQAVGDLGIGAIGAATGIQQLQNGYGLLGMAMRGESDTLKHAAGQAMTFAVFGLMHHGPSRGRNVIEEANRVLQQARQEGLSQQAQGERLMSASRPIMEALRENANLTQSEAMKAAQAASGGKFSQRLAEILAKTFPDKPAAPAAPHVNAPVTPEQAAQRLGAEQARIAVEGRNARPGTTQLPIPKIENAQEARPGTPTPQGGSVVTQKPQVATEAKKQPGDLKATQDPRVISDAIATLQATGLKAKEANAKVNEAVGSATRPFKDIAEVIASTAKPGQVKASTATAAEVAKLGVQPWEAPRPPALPTPREARAHLEAHLAGDVLTAAEKNVLKQRLADPPVSMEKIGGGMILSRARVKQIEAQAIAKTGMEGSIESLIRAPRAAEGAQLRKDLSPSASEVQGSGKKMGKQEILDAAESRLTEVIGRLEQEIVNGPVSAEFRARFEKDMLQLQDAINQGDRHAIREALAATDPSRVAETLRRAEADFASEVKAQESESPAGRAGESERQPAGPGFGQPVTEAENRGVLLGGGQENATGQIPKKQSALANAKIDADRAQRQEPPLLSRARMEDAEVWDRAMERLEQDPQTSVRLIDELTSKPRATTVEENALLLHRQVAVKNEYARANLDAIRIYRDKASTPEALASADHRVEYLRVELDRIEKVARETGTEWGRAGQFRRQLAAEDFTLGSMLRQAEAANKKPFTKEEAAKITDQQAKIDALQKKLAELEEALANRGGPGTPAEITAGRARVRDAEQDFLRDLRDLREKNLTSVQRIWGTAKELQNATRALITSGDLSHILRQGGFTFFSNPLVATKAIPESLKAFGSKESTSNSRQAVSDRPNGVLYEQSGLRIVEGGASLSLKEEAYSSKWAEKIPIVAGSERAYTTYLNRIRADVFDMMADSFSGKGMSGRILSAFGMTGKMSAAEAKAIANFANASTGYGKWGESVSWLSNVFFSPRYVASRFQLLTLEPLWHGNARTRIVIGTEYAKYAVGLGVLYSVARLLGDDKTLTFDPRSADFGKIRIGETRIDPLSGLSQSIVATSRIISGRRTTASGQVIHLRGPNRPYRGDTTWDVFADFWRRKFAPVPGAAVNVVTGEDALHRELGTARGIGVDTYQAAFGPAGKTTRATVATATDLTMPFVLRDIYEAMITELKLPTKTAISLLAILGMGTQTYDRRR